MTKRAKQVKPGDRQIVTFSDSLAEILGSDDLPPGVAGDLSDLLDTLRRGERLLIELMELKAGFKQEPAGKLFELEILIGDDLRMIVRDLLPSLKKVRKAALLRHKGKAGAEEQS